MPTSAKFQIFNGWRKTLYVNAKGENLAGDFPTPLTVASSLLAPEEPVKLSADESLSQSWIGLQLGKCEVGVDLGRILFNAGVRYKNGAKEQVEVIVAPVDPGKASGYDYFIWVLASPGKLQEILSSAIDANLQAARLMLQKANINRTFGSFNLKLADVEPEKLECTYAAITKQGLKSSWNANLVLSFTGKAIGHLNGAAFGIKFEELQAYIGAKLVTNDPVKKIEIKIERFQVAVKKIDGVPLSGPASYYLPGVVNTTYNQDIINGLNDALKKNITDNLPKDFQFGSLEKLNPPEMDKTPASKGQYQTWMSKPHIQDKTLSHIRMPATHDSHTYKLEKTLSSVIYEDQEFLKHVSPDKAPQGYDYSKKSPTDKLTYYLGSKLHDFLMEQVCLLAQCHDATRTIQRQLEDGIRRFDIRIWYDGERKEYGTAHTMRGPSLEEILDSIRAFVDKNRNSQELMIVELSHAWFDKDEHTLGVAEMCKKKLGEWTWLPFDSSPNERYDFQKLKDVRLSSITQGTPKILFVNPDDRMYPHTVLNVKEYTNSAPDNAQAGSGLYSRYFTTTPGNDECAGGVMINLFDPALKAPFLKQASWRNNAEVKDVLKNQPAVNFYIMDWYTECKKVGPDGKGPVDWIIESNN